MIHDIFEEQTSISKVVNRVMKRSLKLMKCEHCSVMLLNEPLAETEGGPFEVKHQRKLHANNFLTHEYCILFIRIFLFA
jgi:hypothetical protein